MIKNIIYDFDGTLSDTYPIVTDVLWNLLRENGKNEEWQKVFDLLKISFRHALSSYEYPVTGEDTRRMFRERVDEGALTRQQPFAEAAEILAFAAEHGVRNFVYTHSGETTGMLLQKWGLAPYVTFVLDSSFGFPFKPDPAAMHFLLEKYDIDPKTALMVGDRDIDVQVGHNAGVAGCLFDTGNYYPDCNAEYRVQNLLEIKKIILAQ